jgi:hypothetical protein
MRTLLLGYARSATGDCFNFDLPGIFDKNTLFVGLFAVLLELALEK